MSNHVKTVSQCKVCMSQFRNRIESLHVNGLSPEKIYDYLQNLSGDEEKKVILKEDIKPSSIRRHLNNHFNQGEEAKVKIAETKARIEQSRNLLQQGVQITIDKVNSLSHLIDTAMIKLEEVEHSNDPKKHSTTIQYMNTIKGLIESLSKLTGELKQEGTIDINFFNNEISSFAEIVLQTIRIIDGQLGLNGQLEIKFSQEFTQQWQNFQERQMKVLAGEKQVSAVNNFNESN